MSLTINAAQLADTGFVLFVVFTCGYSLFVGGQDNSARSKKWIQELAVLQETIRELIGEASSASSHLDRTLQRRKLELEKLLSKIDSNQSYSLDLPNESWAEKPKQKRSGTLVAEGEVTSSSIKHRQERATPRSQVSTQRQRAPLSQQSELAKRIEVFLEDKKPGRMVAEESTDPAAYKIAKRLLESGKEIHIVAKKVGLPIEEVRVLDGMINGPSEVVDETHLIRATEPQSVPSPSTYTRSKQIVSSSSTTHELDVEDEVMGLIPEPGQIRRATTFL